MSFSRAEVRKSGQLAGQCHRGLPAGDEGL